MATRLDSGVPSFTRDGPSALSQVVLYSALALFLMVADARFKVTEPLRRTMAGMMYPVQWLTLQPVAFVQGASGYMQSLQHAQDEAAAAREKLAQLSQNANQAELLLKENERLRQLLDLRERLTTPSQAAQILYDTADPYRHRVVVDQGKMHGVELGSPVLDASGIVGQVTRVQPYLSEVTLLIDRDQAIPVLNVRTGARGVAYGDPVVSHGGGMELRFVSANADVQEGDLLATSGMDGVYPAGLPVARVLRVDRRADSAFARIYCKPVAQIEGARHVMLLKPVAGQLPATIEPETPPESAPKKGRRK